MSRPRAILFRNFEEIVSGTALLIVVFAVCWGVVTRYITDQPAAWSGEVAAMAFAWVTFVGAAAGFKRGMHVSIDMLVKYLPATGRRLFEGVLDLIVIAFCGYVTWLALGFTIDNWDNPSSVLRLPLSIVYAGVLLGFALITWRYGQAALLRWRGTPIQPPEEG